MLARRTGKVLLAMATPVLPEQPTLDDVERDQVLGEMEEFLLRAVSAMPRYLLTPFMTLVCTADALAGLRYGRALRRLPTTQRTAIVRRWARGPVGPLRDALKLVRNYALFFYLDHPLVRRSLARAGSERVDGASHKH